MVKSNNKKKAVSNAIVSNVGGTSIKPSQMYEKIEALVPAGPYLELFCRVKNRHLGWVTAGNEAISLQKNLIRLVSCVRSLR